MNIDPTDSLCTVPEEVLLERCLEALDDLAASTTSCPEAEVGELERLLGDLLSLTGDAA